MLVELRSGRRGAESEMLGGGTYGGDFWGVLGSFQPANLAATSLVFSQRFSGGLIFCFFCHESQALKGLGMGVAMVTGGD